MKNLLQIAVFILVSTKVALAQNTFPASGNVGIGTTSPTGSLDVFRGTGVNGTALFRGTTYGSHFNYSTAEDTYIRGGKADSKVIINDIAGNVGIGTSSPGSTFKLAVAGKIAAWEEVHVYNLNTAFPDYVFEKNYRLRPLWEVEKFIVENKHLPEIPSAKTVQTEGMGLAEMNTLAIKKIEELTLYLIEQEKQLKALHEENKKLQKRVSNLEK